MGKEAAGCRRYDIERLCMLMQRPTLSEKGRSGAAPLHELKIHESDAEEDGGDAGPLQGSDAFL